MSNMTFVDQLDIVLTLICAGLFQASPPPEGVGVWRLWVPGGPQRARLWGWSHQLNAVWHPGEWWKQSKSVKRCKNGICVSVKPWKEWERVKIYRYLCWEGRCFRGIPNTSWRLLMTPPPHLLINYKVKTPDHLWGTYHNIIPQCVW